MVFVPNDGSYRAISTKPFVFPMAIRGSSDGAHAAHVTWLLSICSGEGEEESARIVVIVRLAASTNSRK